VSGRTKNIYVRAYCRDGTGGWGGRATGLAGKPTGARSRETERERDGRGERNGIKTALARAKATGRSRFPQFTTADVRRARAAATAYERRTRWWRRRRRPFPFFSLQRHTHSHGYDNILSGSKRGWSCGWLLIVTRGTVFSIKEVFKRKIIVSPCNEKTPPPTLPCTHCSHHRRRHRSYGQMK